MNKNRGVMLIGILILTIVVMGLVTAMVALTPQDLVRVGHSKRIDLAEAAARTGTTYALARLRENPEWGPSDEMVVTVNSANLYVTEHRGNVVGLVGGPNTPVSQFRIRFNHQDGSGGEDSLEDPHESMFFDMNEVSRNNLFHSLPTTTLNSVHNFVVPDQSRQVVPERRVFLSVEGRAGPALTQLSRDQPNANLSTAQVSRRVLQSIYAPSDIAFDRLVPEGVALAAGVFETNLTNRSYTRGDSMLKFLQGDSVNNAIRSKGGVRVLGGSNPSGNFDPGDAGSVSKGENSTFAARLSPGYPDFEVAVEGVEDPFYQIPFDELRLPPTSAPSMKAGVYVYHKDSGEFRYHDMEYEEYVRAVELDPALPGEPAVFSSNTRIVDMPYALGGNPVDRKSIRIVGDLNITSTTNTRGLTILPRRGAKESGSPVSDPSQFKELPLAPGQVDDGTPQELLFHAIGSPRQDESTIYCPGDVHIASTVSMPGNSLISGGSVRIVGGTRAEASRSGEESISIFAREDIFVSTFNQWWTDHFEQSGRGVGDFYGTARLKGVLYALRNLELKAGDANPGIWGDIQMTGSMVAYGGDSEGQPGNQILNPENPQIGRITLTGHLVELLFDPSYLAGVQNTRPSSASFNLLTSVWLK